MNTTTTTLRTLPVHARSRRWLRLACVMLGAMALGACSSVGQYTRETSGFDASGAFQLTDRNVVEPVDLGYLLLRYAPAPELRDDVCSQQAAMTPRWARGGVAADEQLDGGEFASQDRTRLDRSVRYFACRVERATEDQRRQARNAMQERLLASSEQRCSAFKIGLQRSFSRTNFGLGILTTMAGTAGALVSSVGAARNWAGTAAISSGVRAEYNQDFFSNLAAHVVIEGIDKRRRDVYQQIQHAGQAKAYADYPVEAAIKDAMFYHGQCSVAAGFQQAADAIRLFDDPGLNTGMSMIAKLKAANQLMLSQDLSADELLKRSKALLEHMPKLAGSQLSGGKPAGDPEALPTLNLALATLAAAVDDMKGTVQQFRERRPASAPGEDEMGIKAVDFSTTGLPAALPAACRQATATLVASEQSSAAAALVEPDAGKRSGLLGDAAKAGRQAQLIAEQAQTLALAYRVRVGDSIAAWTVSYAKAVDPKNARARDAAAELKSALGQLPNLAGDAGLASLKKLCASN